VYVRVFLAARRTERATGQAARAEGHGRAERVQAPPGAGGAPAGRRRPASGLAFWITTPLLGPQPGGGWSGAEVETPNPNRWRQ
jgi:hypothetical protein